MQTLSAADLLRAWDAGQRQYQWERALNFLALACPGRTRSDLAQVSLGERDRLLLDLRRSFFGEDIEGLVDCPLCGEHLQLLLRTADLMAPRGRPPGPYENSGRRVEFRGPNSADLECLRDVGDMATGRAILIGRCVQNVMRGGDQVPVSDLPAELVRELARELEEADPQDNVELALDCTACGHNWQQLFDIVAFLWAEVHGWALRTLYEVHRLASAYGWSEAEIIAMHPQRRQMYLEMLGA